MPTMPAITLDTSVEEVMSRFPAAIAVFLRRRMRCVGCAVGPFHTVRDAAGEYGVAAEALLAELREAAAAAAAAAT
jgi:hybrid cluster-associated redox disulfide protein